MWCLMKATYKDRKTMVGLQEVKLSRGQFVTGRKAASVELNFKEASAWKYLKTLEKMQVISLKSNNKFTIVTIDNWEDYQAETEMSNNKVTADEQQNNNRVTMEEQRSVDIEKGVKVVSENHEDIPLDSNNKKRSISIDTHKDYEFDSENSNNKVTAKEQQDNSKVTTKEQQSNTNKKEKKDKEWKERKEKKKGIPFLNLFENKFGIVNINWFTPDIVEKLNYFQEQGISSELVQKAIDEAFKNNKKSIGYICGILNNWMNQDVVNLEDLGRRISGGSVNECNGKIERTNAELIQLQYQPRPGESTEVLSF